MEDPNVARLELENHVMRDYINHQNELARRPFAGIFLWNWNGLANFHDGDGCDVCTRLVSTFFPHVPWKGWAT